MASAEIRWSNGNAGLLPDSIVGEGFYFQYGAKLVCDETCTHPARDGAVRLFATQEERDGFIGRNRHKYKKVYRAVKLSEWRTQ